MNRADVRGGTELRAQAPNVDVHGALIVDALRVSHARSISRPRENTMPGRRASVSSSANSRGFVDRIAPSTLTVCRSRSIVMSPMTVTSSTGGELFARSATSRIAMRAMTRSASCALGLLKTAVTISFSSTVVLSKRTHKSTSALDENAHALHVMPEVNGVAKRRAEGARKNFHLPVIRAHANYVFNVVLGARSVHLPWASR